MKSFVLLSLVAACLGEHPGYNYQQPEGIPIQPFAPFEPHQTYGVPSQYGGGAGGDYHQPQLNYVPAQSENYHKQFYSFIAPNDEFEDHEGAQRIAASIQKNVRVIFIRAPENKGLENAVLQLAKSASDDKTAIYVLNKQADIGDLASRLNDLRDHHAHKPEVHFVKYRTPEDAVHAQQHIQAQYDTLPGTTQNSNGGVAPVLDFASKQPVPTAASYGPVGGARPSYGGLFAGYQGSVATEAGYSGAALPASLGYPGAFGASVGYSGASAVYSGASAGYPGPLAAVAGYSGNFDADSYARTSNAGSNYNSASFGYGNDLQSNQENIVSKINERLSYGSKFVFPTEGSNAESTYLPPLKRRRSL